MVMYLNVIVVFVVRSFIYADLNKAFYHPNENWMIIRIMVIICHENNVTKQMFLLFLEICFIYFMQNVMSLFSFVHCQNRILKYLENR